jgi:uncharacterized repeat protein (TIGR01451 family)
MNPSCLKHLSAMRRASRGMIALAATLVLLLLATPADAATVAIDDFSVAQGPYSLSAPAQIGLTNGGVVSDAGILGSERDIQTTLLNGAFNNIDVIAFGGQLSHSQGATVTATTLVVWDGADGDQTTIDPTGLGGVDLTDGGTQDALRVRLASADLGSTLIIEIFTDGANSSTATLSLAGGALNQDFDVPYSSFVVNLGTGADLTNVGAIALTIDGSAVAALDVIIELLQTTSLVTGEKTVNDLNGNTADPGDVLEYSVVLANADDGSDADASSVVFTDTVDADAFLDCTAPGDPTTTQGTVSACVEGYGGSLTVDIGTIAEATSVTVTFQTTIRDPLPGGKTLCNQGSFTYTGLTGRSTDDPGTGTADDATCLNALPVELMSFRVE